MTKWAGMGNGPDEAAPLFVIPTTSGRAVKRLWAPLLQPGFTERDHCGEAIHPKAVALDACLMVGLPAHHSGDGHRCVNTWYRGLYLDLGAW